MLFEACAVLCPFRMDMEAIGHAIIVPMQGGTGVCEAQDNISDSIQKRSDTIRYDQIRVLRLSDTTMAVGAAQFQSSRCEWHRMDRLG